MSDNHHFVTLPRDVARSINSPAYYPLKACRAGHTTGRRTKHGSCKACSKTNERTYTVNNQVAVWFKCKRNSAKHKGIEFTITLQDILPIPDKCPVLDIPLKFYQGRGSRGFFQDSISLDRIDPSKGYIKGNVRVISGRANSLKNDASLEEIERIYNYMKDNL